MLIVVIVASLVLGLVFSLRGRSGVALREKEEFRTQIENFDRRSEERLQLIGHALNQQLSNFQHTLDRRLDDNSKRLDKRLDGAARFGAHSNPAGSHPRRLAGPFANPRGRRETDQQGACVPRPIG